MWRLTSLALKTRNPASAAASFTAYHMFVVTLRCESIPARIAKYLGKATTEVAYDAALWRNC